MTADYFHDFTFFHSGLKIDQGHGGHGSWCSIANLSHFPFQHVQGQNGSKKGHPANYMIQLLSIPVIFNINRPSLVTCKSLTLDAFAF
jgi:hypothetical protein